MSLIRIEFERGGTFHARLLEDEAPKTCGRIKAHLPFAYRFHHSIVSGQALVTLPPDLTMPRENQRVAGIPPGALSFLVRDEPVLVPDEIYIAYGIFISRGLTLDAKQPVNVFAQIDDSLEDLRAVGRRVLMQGAETVRFSLVGSAGHTRRRRGRARNA
ncbi:MAG: DUF3830 family protein [Armatimonadota bacterium]|nr:DUF3830 family protein [Armatimonadota bacterium]